MVQLNFNATGVKPNAALEPVPSGHYPVMITASTKKPTQAGTGAYIELEMTIQQGEFKGRKLYDRLNIENPNQTAVDIAYATLSAICHVTGRLAITATEQLHGVPFIAVVVKKPRNDQPDVQTNEVKGYKDINGNDPGAISNAGGGQQYGQQGGQMQNGPSWGNNPNMGQQGGPSVPPAGQNPANNWNQQGQQGGWNQGGQQGQQGQPQNSQTALDPNEPPPWAR